jgi:hypothetical protein
MLSLGVILSIAAVSGVPETDAMDVLFHFHKDQSYSAVAYVDVGPVPSDAKYLHFTMRVPECTDFALYAEEGDGEVWALDVVRVVLSGASKEYFIPFTEELGREPRMPNIEAGAIAVTPYALSVKSTPLPKRKTPRSDGRLSPSSVNRLYFFFKGVTGLGTLGTGVYKAWNLQFVSESPFERSLAALDRLSVKVDANKSLGHLNPIWRDIFWSTEATASLPQRAVRIADSSPGTLRAFPQDGPDGEFNWKGVDRILKQSLERAEFAIHVMGRDVPVWLWDPEKPESSRDYWAMWKRGHVMPARDLKAYEELQYRAVTHFVEANFNVTHYEFTTEPDEPLWFLGTAEEYNEMYAAFARGVKRANPQAKVGCPGLLNYNMHWLRSILRFCKSENVPLDFVSFHHYGTHARAFGDHIAHFRALVAAEFPQYKDVEIMWSEWNRGLMHDESVAFKRTAANAAFAADSIRYMADQDVDIATFAFAHWGAFWKGMGLFLQDATPKPVYNTLRLFAQMEGTQTLRVPVHVAADDALGIGAFAAKADEHVAVAVWWNAETPYRNGISRQGTLQIGGIPFSGPATMRRYLIDENHSNFNAGSEHQDLEMVEERSVSISGEVWEARIEVAPSCVQLLKLTPTKTAP